MTTYSWAMLAAQSCIALYLVVAWLHVSYGIAWNLSVRHPLSILWSVASLIFFYLVTVLFHLLTALNSFNVRAAFLVTVAAQLVFHFFVMPFRAAMRAVVSDVQTIARAFRKADPAKVIWVGVFGGLACVPMAKTLLIPPLGWDAVSYHLAKAAMWVQSGNLATLTGPGGWSYFPLFPGGGDLIYAWALLPFRSDLLACATGAVVWAGGAGGVYALARALGVSRSGSGAAAVLVLWTPAVHRIAGSGYVEPILQLYTTLMAVCAVRYFETKQAPFLALSWSACGLMMGVKVMGLVSGAVAIGALAVYASVVHRREARHWLAMGAGLILVLMAVWPWWLRAVQQTGHPLSPLPIRLFGIELGRINPDLQWIQNRPCAEFSWAREWLTLKSVFLWNADTPALGLSWAVLLVLLLVMWPRLMRSAHRWAAGFLFLLIAVFLCAYHHPHMLVLRTFWPTSNARYWIQILPLLAALLAAGAESFQRGRRMWIVAAIAISAWNTQRELFWGVSGVTLTHLPLAAGILFGVAALIWLMVMRGWFWGIAAILLCATPVLAIRLTEYRDAHRWDIYADEGTKSYHGLLRYWVRAAEHLDQPETPFRIAVTSAPWQNGDNWLVYPFLGRRFQNRLAYIPISVSGEIVPFDGTTRYLETAHPAAWVARLYQHGITHVMSFWPPSVEVSWMLNHPQIFECMVVGRKWGGCFRVKPWSQALQELERSGREPAAAVSR